MNNKGLDCHNDSVLGCGPFLSPAQWRVCAFRDVFLNSSARCNNARAGLRFFGVEVGQKWGRLGREKALHNMNTSCLRVPSIPYSHVLVQTILFGCVFWPTLPLQALRRSGHQRLPPRLRIRVVDLPQLLCGQDGRPNRRA